MHVRHKRDGQYLFMREATDVSEIPCRLIDDVHEGCNEISIVPG